MAGSRIYGLAALLLGAVMLAAGDFSGTWQPVPDTLPQRALFAYAAGALFIATGLALVLRRWERPSALAIAAVSLVFAAGWGGRIAAQPTLFAVWLGLAEQLAVVLGGLAIVVSRGGPAAQALRVGFGLCLLAFGAAHLIYLKETAEMVPAWLPPGERAWALATGVADIAAGIAVLTGPLALLATRLAAAMFAGFGVLVWLPLVAAAPGEPMNWFGTAVTLTIAAGTWALADLIARTPPPAWWRRGR